MSQGGCGCTTAVLCARHALFYGESCGCTTAEPCVYHGLFVTTPNPTGTAIEADLLREGRFVYRVRGDDKYLIGVLPSEGSLP